MDRLGAMELFARVVETGSFSAAAKERGIGQPAVSKQISALEVELGTELLHRNTRSLLLTESGREFYQSARKILEDFESATSRIGRGQTAPKGLVRIAVPPAFARLHMISKLTAFLERYPEITVEFGTSDNPASLIQNGFDVAIHSGDLPDSTLVARRFAQTLRILVATPRLIAQHGLPQTIEELHMLPAIPWMESGGVQPWQLAPGQTLTPAGVFRTGDLEQLRVGVLEHLGVARVPAWLFAAELREGTVLRLLTSYESSIPISAVRPASRRAPARVRVLVQHFEESFAMCTQFNPRPAAG